MLDFAFGPNGYGLTEGMRKEQDRITQNRTQFANNMATFLANNPYISPEAAQAFINSAAGTDNTLRGSVPNQLIGELNKENTRKRRIDTFQAFNEFTRLNPGASAAEFQSAMSALGAQGIYGADALKAIQGRADQYRKDQDTKRLYTEAQNIGQLRTQLMADAKSIFIQNGYDVEKTKKQLESIYGKNMPVPIDSIVNPGMATTLQGDLIREYLPKAVDIIGKNPNMTPEMLYGIFPELQGSPVVKSIYDAAQTERKKSISDKLYGNKKQVVDSVASSIMLGSDPQTALSETIRGLGISPEDMANLDTSTILAEANSLAKKSKDDQQQKLDASLAGAKGKMYESIRTNTLADPVTLQTLSSGDITAVESFVRARIRDESGLTDAEIAKIPDSYYRSLAVSIQGQIINKSRMEQAQTYDTAKAQGPKILSDLQEQNRAIAKNYDGENVAAAIKNAGLDQSVSGAMIPTIMKSFAEKYDLSNGGADRLFSALIQAASENPDAGVAIGETAARAAGLAPLSAVAEKKVEDLSWQSGAVTRTPIPATNFMAAETQKMTKQIEGVISTITTIAANKAQLPDDKISILERHRQVLLATAQETEGRYSVLLNNARSFDYNDRFTPDHVAKLVGHGNSEVARAISSIDRTIEQLKTEEIAAKKNTTLPSELAERPRNPYLSSFGNDFRNIVPTEGRRKMIDMQSDLRGAGGYSMGAGPLGYFYKTDAERETYGYINSIAQSPEALAILTQRPDLYALIDPNNPNTDPQRFVEEFKKIYQSGGQ